MGDNGRALRKGDDVAALKVAFEHHAAGLYDFGRWMLGRADAAEDAVHGVLIGALGRRGLLWNPDKLRTWLYTALRNECLRARRREPLDTPPTAPDQEVLELALRHRLSPDALAIVVGLPVHTVRRMLTQDQDQDRYRTADPIRPAPDELYGRILESARIPDRVTYFTERAQPYTRAGYPVPVDRPESRRLLPIALGAVAVIMITLLTSLLTTDQPPPSSAARLPEPSVVLSSDVPLEPSLTVRSPSVSPSTRPTPSRTPSRSPKPKPPAPKPPSTGPAPGVRIMLADSRCGRGGWTVHVALLTSGPATRSATVTWWTRGRSPVTVTAFRMDDTTYAAQLRGLPQNTEVSFRGAAVSVAGRTGQSATTSAAGSCDGGRTRR